MMSWAPMAGVEVDSMGTGMLGAVADQSMAVYFANVHSSINCTYQYSLHS